MPRVTAVLLAAGISSRMGSENKLLLPYRGTLIVARAVDTILVAGIQDVIVVVGHESSRVRSALPQAGVTIVENAAYAEGMSTSIVAGVSAAPPTAEGFLICLADQPQLEPADLVKLTDAFAQAVDSDPVAIVVPTYEGSRGNPVLFSSHYKAQMLAVRGLHGCRDILTENPDHIVPVEMDSDSVLRDVDTPEVYRKLTRDE